MDDIRWASRARPPRPNDLRKKVLLKNFLKEQLSSIKGQAPTNDTIDSTTDANQQTSNVKDNKDAKETITEENPVPGPSTADDGTTLRNGKDPIEVKKFKARLNWLKNIRSKMAATKRHEFFPRRLSREAKLREELKKTNLVAKNSSKQDNSRQTLPALIKYHKKKRKTIRVFFRKATGASTPSVSSEKIEQKSRNGTLSKEDLRTLKKNSVCTVVSMKGAARSVLTNLNRTILIKRKSAPVDGNNISNAKTSQKMISTNCSTPAFRLVLKNGKTISPDQLINSPKEPSETDVNIVNSINSESRSVQTDNSFMKDFKEFKEANDRLCKENKILLDSLCRIISDTQSPQKKPCEGLHGYISSPCPRISEIPKDLESPTTSSNHINNQNKLTGSTDNQNISKNDRPNCNIGRSKSIQESASNRPMRACNRRHSMLTSSTRHNRIVTSAWSGRNSSHSPSLGAHSSALSPSLLRRSLRRCSPSAALARRLSLQTGDNRPPVPPRRRHTVQRRSSLQESTRNGATVTQECRSPVQRLLMDSDNPLQTRIKGSYFHGMPYLQSPLLERRSSFQVHSGQLDQQSLPRQQFSGNCEGSPKKNSLHHLIRSMPDDDREYRPPVPYRDLPKDAFF